MLEDGVQDPQAILPLDQTSTMENTALEEHGTYLSLMLTSLGLL